MVSEGVRHLSHSLEQMGLTAKRTALASFSEARVASSRVMTAGPLNWTYDYYN